MPQQTRQLTRFTLWVLAASTIVALPLVAQPQRRQLRHTPKYDPANEVTVQGAVADIEEVESPTGLIGIHFELESEADTHEVCVGPASEVAKRGFVFEVGDRLVLVGATWQTPEGSEIVIAREITRGDAKLTLRDERGVPVWSRGQRRPSRRQ